MTNVEDIRKYSFKEEEKLFIDANIWYFVYGPKPKTPEERISRTYYTYALQKIAENKCKVFINILVLAEFINRYSKYFLDQYNKNLPPYEQKKLKNYRNTPIFKEKVKLIVNEARKIAKIAELCSPDFSGSEIDFNLSEYINCNFDFNDIIHKYTAQKNAFVIVTDDVDFKNCCVPILTANNNLLS